MHRLSLILTALIALLAFIGLVAADSSDSEPDASPTTVEAAPSRSGPIIEDQTPDQRPLQSLQESSSSPDSLVAPATEKPRERPELGLCDGS